MPWNDQGGGGGPWGGSGGGQRPGGQSPWGKPGGGGGQRPPDLEDQIRKFQERFKGAVGGGGGGTGGKGGGRRMGGAGILVIAALGLLGWLSTGVYVVDAGEEAVVLRFGQEHRSTGAGFHVHLPAPIETHIIVPIERVNRVNVGFSGNNRSGDIPQESLMLTGDENIVDIDFTVLWRISDAGAFLFNIEDPENTVKAVAESAMREVIGKRNLEAIITRERGVVQSETRDLIQAVLDDYNSGILVTQVQLAEAGPPATVIEAFRDVASAEQDAAANENQATAYRNRVVTEARGEAARIVQEAEAYRDSVIREATGDASRFNAIYDEYRKAPRVTRERMYLETMEQVLSRSEKIVIDNEGGGVVPFLPLDRLTQQQRTAQGARQ